MNVPYPEFCKKFGLEEMPPPSEGRTLHTVWRFSLQISSAKLWPYIADTSSFNRKLGMAPREEKEIDGKKYVTTTMLGFRQAWIEEPWTWFHGKSIRSVRNYTQGIGKKVCSNFILDPTPQGVDFYVNFSWIPKNNFSYYFLKATLPIIKKKFEQVLATIQVYTEIQENRLPAALKVINDPTKNVNLLALEKAAQNLKEKNLLPAAVDGLCEFIKTGDDNDLHRIKVLSLASALNLPKKEVLRVCMEGVRYGLLSITWDVICPHCRGVRMAAGSLAEVKSTQDCLVCEVDFQTDNLESIEVVFHVQPNYRKVTEVLFCAAEPAKKDHIQVKQEIRGHEKLQFTQAFLKEGRHRIRLTNPSANYYFEVKKGVGPSEIIWNAESETPTLTYHSEISFQLENTTEQNRSLSIEQLWWKDNALHPADIFAMPEYRSVFSRESLNADVKISMGAQVIMFTDIVNSTVFYTEKGDAAAFNEVKKHFAEVFQAVDKNEGLVIKTIGDSIMACFSNADLALQSAVDIQNIFHRTRLDTSIRLRVSLNYGQVIAVHLLQGLDLFGTTVNKAAKLQACANTGEVSFSEEFLLELNSTTLKNCLPFVTERKSTVMFKELPLEAHVLNIHSMTETMDLKADAS